MNDQPVESSKLERLRLFIEMNPNLRPLQIRSGVDDFTYGNLSKLIKHGHVLRRGKVGSSTYIANPASRRTGRHVKPADSSPMTVAVINPSGRGFIHPTNCRVVHTDHSEPGPSALDMLRSERAELEKKIDAVRALCARANALDVAIAALTGAA